MYGALKTVPSREGDIYFLLLRFSAMLENIAEITILKSISTCILMDPDDLNVDFPNTGFSPKTHAARAESGEMLDTELE